MTATNLFFCVCARVVWASSPAHNEGRFQPILRPTTKRIRAVQRQRHNTSKPRNTRTYKRLGFPLLKLWHPPYFMSTSLREASRDISYHQKKIRFLKPLVHSMYNITPPTCFEFCIRTFFTTRWYRTYKIRVRKQESKPDYPENLTPNQFQNTKWQEFQN